QQLALLGAGDLEARRVDLVAEVAKGASGGDAGLGAGGLVVKRACALEIGQVERAADGQKHRGIGHGSLLFPGRRGNAAKLIGRLTARQRLARLRTWTRLLSPS